MLNVETMSLLELKDLAKQYNIKNTSKLKKDELIIVLKQIIDEPEQTNTCNKTLEKETVERQYDVNGEPIVDYKLTNEGDEIVEGILDILPDRLWIFKRRKFSI